jgi:hypothetical protein
MKRFQAREVVYLGINGVSEQDEFVKPFVEQKRLSFTPLMSTPEVLGADGYDVKGFPTNLLIDRQGRIVYRGFTATDAKSEGVLQQMIEGLLGGG